MLDKLLDKKYLLFIASIIGAVLLLSGAMLIVFHKKLGIDWPYFLYGGISIMAIGFLCWFTQTILQFILVLKGKKHTCQEEEKLEEK